MIRNLLSFLMCVALFGCASAGKQSGQTAKDSHPSLVGALQHSAAMQDEPASGLSLDSREDAIRFYLESSPAAKVILSELDLAELRQQESSLLKNPMLQIALMAPVDGGRWEVGGGLMADIWNWLSRKQRAQIASAQGELERFQAIGQLLDQLESVQSSWVNAVISTQIAGFEQDRLALMQQAVQLAQRQRGIGELAESDYLLRMIALETVQSAAIQSESDRQIALQALARALGLSSAEQIKIPEKLAAPPGQDMQVRELQALSAMNNPELQAAQAQLRKALADQQLSDSALGKWRDLGLGLSARRNAQGMTMVGPELAAELPVSAATRIDRASSAISGERDEALLVIRERALLLEIEFALAQLAQSKLEIQANLRQLQALRQRLRLLEAQYSQGETGFESRQNAALDTTEADIRLARSGLKAWQWQIKLERLIAKDFSP